MEQDQENRARREIADDLQSMWVTLFRGDAEKAADNLLRIVPLMERGEATEQDAEWATRITSGPARNVPAGLPDIPLLHKAKRAAEGEGPADTVDTAEPVETDGETVDTVVAVEVEEAETHPTTCVLTGAPGENPDDCTTHGHEPEAEEIEVEVVKEEDIRDLTHPVHGWSFKEFTGPDGKPWFMAGHAAATLGYKRTADAIREHCKGVGEIQTPSAGGMQKTKVIPLGDLMSLLMSSTLPRAKDCQDWFCNEVLTDIYMTGSYIPESHKTQVPQDLESALLLAAHIEGERKRLEVQTDLLTTEVKELKPKADRFDAYMNSEGLVPLSSIPDAVKYPAGGTITFNWEMRVANLLEKDGPRPTQWAKDEGYLVSKVTTWTDVTILKKGTPEEKRVETEMKGQTAHATGKGMTYIEELFGDVNRVERITGEPNRRTPRHGERGTA